MNQIKVLLIGYQPPPVGGVTVLFDQLVQDLKEADELDVEVVNMSTVDKGGVAKTRAAARILGSILQKIGKCDVISFHGVTGSTVILGPLVLTIAKILGTPFVFRKFGGSFKRYYEKSGKLKQSVINFLVSGADVSLFETKELVKFFSLLPNADVRYYPNSRGKKANIQSSERAQKFVFLSQIKTQKGVAEVFKAANHVSDSVTVDIFGPGGYDISEEELQRLVKKSRATYHGPVQPEHVFDTLQNYDCLLLPSYWPHEGYPGVIIEAYMAGLPVITTHTGAIPEIVDDSSGMFVDPQNARDLASKMMQLHRNSNLYLRLQRGVQKKAAFFNSARWSYAFQNICKELAE